MIVSRFKDYYDFLCVNNKYIYNRKLFNDDNLYRTNINCLVAFKKLVSIYNPLKTYGINFNFFEDYNLLWVIVCGRRFLIFKKTSNVYWETVSENSEISEYIDNKFFTSPVVDSINLQFNVTNKHPIIVCSIPFPRTGEFLYMCQSPKLDRIKNFVALYPAEQICQDIDCFFLNQINIRPNVK